MGTNNRLLVDGLGNMRGTSHYLELSSSVREGKESPGDAGVGC